MAFSSPPAAVPPSQQWTHTTSPLTLLWLTISLPLVIWDTGYVLLRPYSMPGGFLHWPIWAPYELYGRIDYIYGWKAFNEHNGFTAAQAMLNVVETAMYLFYVWVVVYGYERPAEEKKRMGVLGTRFWGHMRVEGGVGAVAVLVAFSAAVMTFSKTVLYWLNEYFSGFENIGHNELWDLIFFWIIPNGAWLVGSLYMVCDFGAEIINGLAGRKSTSSVDLRMKKQ